MDTEIIFAKQKTAKSLLVVLSKQVAASILLLIASFYPVATTQKIELTSNTTSGSYSINLYSITSATQPGNPGASTTYVSKSGQLLYPVMFPTVTLNSQLFTNPPCVAVFFRYYSTSKQAGVSRSILPQLFFAAHRLYPYCIQRDVTVITPPTNPTNDTAIIRYVISRQLPQPNPSLDPPFALVGLKAFLSSGASLSNHSQTLQEPIKPLSEPPKAAPPTASANPAPEQPQTPPSRDPVIDPNQEGVTCALDSAFALIRTSPHLTKLLEQIHPNIVQIYNNTEKTNATHIPLNADRNKVDLLQNTLKTKQHHDSLKKTLANLKKEAETLKTEKIGITKSIEEVNKSLGPIKNIFLNKETIEKKKKLLATYNDQIKNIDSKLEAKQKNITEIETELKNLRNADIGEVLLKLYPKIPFLRFSPTEAAEKGLSFAIDTKIQTLKSFKAETKEAIRQAAAAWDKSNNPSIEQTISQEIDQMFSHNVNREAVCAKILEKTGKTIDPDTISKIYNLKANELTIAAELNNGDLTDAPCIFIDIQRNHNGQNKDETKLSLQPHLNIGGKKYQCVGFAQHIINSNATEQNLSGGHWVAYVIRQHREPSRKSNKYNYFLVDGLNQQKNPNLSPVYAPIPITEEEFYQIGEKSASVALYSRVS